jgi:threonine aldolase
VEKIIDLRSDTVTQPSEMMRQAMAQAEVGDDYYHDDPTVAKLENFAAELLGHEAGLFVTSGTMGNLVSVLTHTNHGDAIITEKSTHIFHNENGNIASVAGVLPHVVEGTHGIFDSAEVDSRITGSEVLHSRTKLVCIENTHNVSGGTCWPMEKIQQISESAHKNGLSMHIDGARVFNAAVATNIEPAKIASLADSLTFCLSKGLSCPFGSVIVGSKDFIAEARRNRQMVGGGMRQAGIIAAAGIVALESMISRLAEDHKNAKTLAQGLVNLGLEVNLEAVQTNMVYVKIPENSKVNAGTFADKLISDGISVNRPWSPRIRFVTHSGISSEDISKTLISAEKALN